MTDTLLHVLGAAAILGAGLMGILLGPDAGFWLVGGVNAAFWIGREALQARDKYGAMTPPWRWSGQKLEEAAAPVVTGFAIAGIASAIW